MIVEQVGDKVFVQAPAKLNLYLEVLGKRPDGYHEIESLMVAIDLRDSLVFTDDPSGNLALSCDDPALPTDATNLVMKAAARLRQVSGTRNGARIELSKRIPARAGLGGGSSDAAATLVGLNRLWNLNQSSRQLDAIAATLGSDVPFFLGDRAAVCRGRGERVEPVSIAQSLHFVLICPEVGVPTSDAYARVVVPGSPNSISSCLEAFCEADTSRLGPALFNRLQSVAEALAPDLVQVRDTLKTLGPLLDGHLMSGSGSAYFGLCRDKPSALAAAQQLETLGQGRVRVVTCGP